MSGMASENYFGEYTLSESTLKNLNSVRDLLSGDPADRAWNNFRRKQEFDDSDNSDFTEETVENVQVECHEQPPTQFFSQQKSTFSAFTHNGEKVSEWLDLARFLHESLESGHDEPNLEHLKNLSDEDVGSVIKYFHENLSIKGIYNFCHAICSMNDDQGLRYIRIICADLLLEKVIELKEPSRLIITLIQELMKKYADDVQEFIFVPMLNAELQDTSTFLAIIENCNLAQKNDLVVTFMTNVQELQEWHLKILPQLVTSKISDNCATDKLLDFLLKKASICSQDKNFGKFIHSFTKQNSPFTDHQKEILSKVIAANETIYKKIVENLLNKMYLYRDLWHIG